jgi:hypothetical protein
LLPLFSLGTPKEPNIIFMICGGSYVREISFAFLIYPSARPQHHPILQQRDNKSPPLPLRIRISPSPSMAAAAAAATSFTTLVSRGAPAPASFFFLTISQPFNHLTDPLVLLAGRRAFGGAAVPPCLQGRTFAAPLPPWRPHPLAGRLLLRGPCGVALSQPRALRYIRQRRAQGTMLGSSPSSFLL